MPGAMQVRTPSASGRCREAGQKEARRDRGGVVPLPIRAGSSRRRTRPRAGRYRRLIRRHDRQYRLALACPGDEHAQHAGADLVRRRLYFTKIRSAPAELILKDTNAAMAYRREVALSDAGSSCPSSSNCHLFRAVIAWRLVMRCPLQGADLVWISANMSAKTAY